MDSNYDVPMYIAKSNIKLEQFVAIVENKKIYGTIVSSKDENHGRQLRIFIPRTEKSYSKNSKASER